MKKVHWNQAIAGATGVWLACWIAMPLTVLIGAILYDIAEHFILPAVLTLYLAIVAMLYLVGKALFALGRRALVK